MPAAITVATSTGSLVLNDTFDLAFETPVVSVAASGSRRDESESVLWQGDGKPAPGVVTLSGFVFSDVRSSSGAVSVRDDVNGVRDALADAVSITRATGGAYGVSSSSVLSVASVFTPVVEFLDAWCARVSVDVLVDSSVVTGVSPVSYEGAAVSFGGSVVVFEEVA